MMRAHEKSDLSCGERLRIHIKTAQNGSPAVSRFLIRQHSVTERSLYACFLLNFPAPWKNMNTPRRIKCVKCGMSVLVTAVIAVMQTGIWFCDECAVSVEASEDYADTKRVAEQINSTVSYTAFVESNTNIPLNQAMQEPEDFV